MILKNSDAVVKAIKNKGALQLLHSSPVSLFSQMQKAWYECHWLAVYFQALHNDLNLPISVLRVIYDMNDKNPDAVVKAILEK